MRMVVTGMLIVSCLIPGNGISQDRISFGAFMRRMADLDALARVPVPGEACLQFSSYDRRTRYSDSLGTIIQNGANGDRGQFLREEPEGRVLADMPGPGVVVRIWSANAEGILKLFIDGEETPRMAVSMQDLLGGKIPPLTEPLAGVRSRGWNLYLPIPFEKHMKIMVEKPGPLYYHVTWRKLPSGTRVESFQWPLPPAWREEVEALKTVLTHPGNQRRGRPVKVPFVLAPGETLAVREHRGSGTFRGMTLKLDLPAGSRQAEERLRRTALIMEWDDLQKPAVWSPLGDFFGTAPGNHPYPGFPAGVTEEVFYANWVMPFRERAVISLQSFDTEPLRGTFTFWEDSLTMTPPFLYFRADWRVASPVEIFDWPLLVSVGKGRYCGTALFVYNSAGGWWGEGDEKFRVDGEVFPSTFGTGSEDYFGYAWCSTEPFFHPLHNQPLCEGPGNGNYTSVNRFHLADNVPFHTCFLGTIEAYNRGAVTYAATTYWYGTAGATTDARACDLSNIIWPERWEPFVQPGALEGEDLKVVTQYPEFPVGPQNLSASTFSGGRHLWFRPEEEGSVITLALPDTVESGAYRMSLYVTTSWDYAEVQWAFNGREAGPRTDTYSPRILRRKIDCGVVEVKGGGEDRLTLRIQGRNPESTGYFAGLDCLTLVRPGDTFRQD
jgi:hypothetical protein